MHAQLDDLKLCEANGPMDEVSAGWTFRELVVSPNLWV
jgi:hypothetical protein